MVFTMRRIRRDILLFLTIMIYSIVLFIYGVRIGSESLNYKEIVLTASRLKNRLAPRGNSNVQGNKYLETNTDGLSTNYGKNVSIGDNNNSNFTERSVLKGNGKFVSTMLTRNNSSRFRDAYASRNSSDHLTIAKGKEANYVNTDTNRTVLKEEMRNDSHKVSLKRDLSFYRLNTTMSDIIGSNRTIPDTRPDKCKDIKYPDVLPKISVVIIFREEWPSVLIRTVYSILNHSPRNLLREIVLVDDGSSDTEPKLQLKKHFADEDIVKLIVNSKPLGLMMARQTGIDATTSDHFIVMDSHIEVGQGWLVPIIARLVEAPNSLLTPDVGTIYSDTFEIKRKRKTTNNEFIIYDPLQMSELWASYSNTYTRLRNGSVDPIPTASVQGMFIAMKKDFFMRLGGFDPGMKQWGSEQFELSIKVWMCGGRVETIPCSRVVHLYRVTPWLKVNKSSDDFIVANSLRTTEVWFDDPYKSIIREFIGKHSKYDIGDLTDRHRIRKENNCKPFQYFVDMVKTFSDVYLIDEIKVIGCIRNRYLNKCLTLEKIYDKIYKLSIHTCRNNTNQNFILTENDQIRSFKGIIVRSSIGQKQNTNVRIEVAQSIAYSYMRNALWEYRNDGSLYNVASRHCLTVNRDKTLVAERCTGEPIQLWDWHRL